LASISFDVTLPGMTDQMAASSRIDAKPETDDRVAKTPPAGRRCKRLRDP
jgi:hypothetical protein